MRGSPHRREGSKTHEDLGVDSGFGVFDGKYQYFKPDPFFDPFFANAKREALNTPDPQSYP